MLIIQKKPPRVLLTLKSKFLNRIFYFIFHHRRLGAPTPDPLCVEKNLLEKLIVAVAGS